MVSIRTSASMILATLALGCDVSADPTPEVFAARDSSGIRIVENQARSWSPEQEWRVSGEPVLQIGKLEGGAEYQFLNAIGPIRLSDGRIVIGDRTSAQVRYFDGNGGFNGSAGGRGSGPGEFQRLAAIHALPGDSVMAYDIGSDRATVIDDGGVSRRSINIREEYGAGLAGTWGDGSLLLESWEQTTPSGDGLRLANRSFSRVLGTAQRPITMLRSSAFGIQVGRGVSYWSIPFSSEGIFAVRTNRLYASDGSAYEVRVHDEEGAILAFYRLDRAPDPVRDSDLRAYVEAMISAEEDEARRRQLTDDINILLERAPLPATMPSFTSLRADADGNIWAQLFQRPGDDRTRWEVLSSEGTWLGTVETPAGLEVSEIGSDYLLGIWKDELGVEYVRMHRIEKPSA